MKDVVVDDDYCSDEAMRIRKYAVKLSNAMDDYLDILQTLRTGAIKRGDTAMAFDAFIGQVSQLENKLWKPSETAEQRAGDFVRSVDETDEDLY